MSASMGFFSSFNARHLDAEQIARSFVSTPKFMRLLSAQNSLLIGARGSGKTHMLKMLQPKALNAWNHEDAQMVRKQIPYWGVFIPADEAWRQQIDSASESLQTGLQQKFRMAVFSTHVQKSLVDCFLQLTFDQPSYGAAFAKVDLPVEQEFELCKELAHSWKLTPRIHSLSGVRQALVNRAADLYEITDSNTSLLDICQTQAIQAALRGITAFDTIIKRFNGLWCLLFDELEIAPLEIQQVLFRSLRSSDQRLIFKLAISPSTQAASVFRDALGPTSGNDFEEISLYSDTKEAEDFCRQLWGSLAIGTTAEGLSPTTVLGHSTFHTPSEVKPYSKGGRWQAASSNLASKDVSYKKFMQEHGINPYALHQVTDKQLMNSVVRKVAPIVGFRDFMFKAKPSTSIRVIRKDKSRPSILYSGWEALCLVSEGNPRWFTGIAKNLLIQREKSLTRRAITIEHQYAALSSASHKFLDYIATIPQPPSNIGQSPSEGGMKKLVDYLIALFRDEVLINDFTLDPVLSFEIDAAINDDIRRAIFDGLYSGAFIPVGEEDRKFIFTRDLVGLRLRPTYLLAPLEKLPLRTGKSRKLSFLLNRNKQSLRKAGKNKHIVEFLPTQNILLFNE